MGGGQFCQCSQRPEMTAEERIESKRERRKSLFIIVARGMAKGQGMRYRSFTPLVRSF